MLMNYIGSLADATERFGVSLAGSRTVLRSTMSHQMLQSVGITGPCTVHVNWADDGLPHEEAEVVFRFRNAEEGGCECIEELLACLSSKTSEGPSNLVNVDRDSVLEGASIAFSNPRFNADHKLFVRFSGEPAIDGGGPMREFLRLAVMEIRDSSLLCGPEDARIISLDCNALEEETYKLAGMIIGYSIVHGGTLPQFFSTVVYNLITTGVDAKIAVRLADISDHDVRAAVEKIADAENEAEYVSATAKMTEIIDVAGCTSMALRYHLQDRMVSNITKFLVLTRCTEAIKQFLEGLQILSVLKTVRANADLAQQLFVKNGEAPALTATVVERLFSIPEENHSTSGSNRRRSEDKTITHWRNLLMELEGGQCDASLTLLLRLVTGADDIPLLGFTPTPTLAFVHQEDAPAHERRMPRISTCENRLTLPIITRYREFREIMINTIMMLQIFTDS